MGEDSLHVGEMFAGVGGFRLGLEGPPSEDWETEFLKFEETGFKVVWSNQWEPGCSKQWASSIYTERFGGRDMTEAICTTLPKVLKLRIRFHNSIYWSADFPAKTTLWLVQFLEN